MPLGASTCWGARAEVDDHSVVSVKPKWGSMGTLGLARLGSAPSAWLGLVFGATGGLTWETRSSPTHVAIPPIAAGTSGR